MTALEHGKIWKCKVQSVNVAVLKFVDLGRSGPQRSMLMSELDSYSRLRYALLLLTAWAGLYLDQDGENI